MTEDLKGSIYEIGNFFQAFKLVTTTKVVVSYADRTCTDPQDIRIDIEKLEDVTLVIPLKQDDIYEYIVNILIRKDLVTYVNIIQLYHQKKVNLYYVVLGNCMEAMKNRLEGEGSFDDIDKESDLINLINLSKIILYTY